NFCRHTADSINPPVLTCNIFNGSVVNPGDTVVTTLEEVTNPTSTAANPTVSTPSLHDALPICSPNTGNSANYQIVGQNPVTNVTASNTQVSQAAGARTRYKAGFTASPTGGLAGAAGSQFTITFPNGTDITQIFSWDIHDNNTNT